MSARGSIEGVGTGELSFDLGDARDDERVPLPGVRYVAVVEAGNEATVKFGSPTANGLDPRDYNAFELPGEPGEMYLSNPSNAGATLRIVPTDGRVRPQPATKVREISEVTGNVDADVTDRTGRDLGKARLMDDSGVLVSDTNPLAAARPTATGLDYGEQIVSNAGTAEALNGGTSVTVPDGFAVLVRALVGNTGDVYVGDSNVTTADGYPLGGGETVSLGVDDVSTVEVDADNANDGVRWIVEVA